VLPTEGKSATSQQILGSPLSGASTGVVGVLAEQAVSRTISAGVNLMLNNMSNKTSGLSYSFTLMVE
jgi:hypothetical protein